MYQEDIKSLKPVLTDGERQNLRSLKRHLKKELGVNHVQGATERIDAMLAEEKRREYSGIWFGAP